MTSRKSTRSFLAWSMLAAADLTLSLDVVLQDAECRQRVFDRQVQSRFVFCRTSKWNLQVSTLSGVLTSSFSMLFVRVHRLHPLLFQHQTRLQSRLLCFATSHIITPGCCSSTSSTAFGAPTWDLPLLTPVTSCSSALWETLNSVECGVGLPSLQQCTLLPHADHVGARGDSACRALAFFGMHAAFTNHLKQFFLWVQRTARPPSFQGSRGLHRTRLCRVNCYVSSHQHRSMLLRQLNSSRRAFDFSRFCLWTL